MLEGFAMLVSIGLVVFSFGCHIYDFWKGWR